jgi:hypothetical protein
VHIVLVALFFMMAALTQAGAQTPCPSVSDQIQIINPTIVGAPFPVQLAIYDQTSLGLAIQPAGPGNPAIYFVGVPRSLIVGRNQVQWASISGYPQALVQTNSTCPVLTVEGNPIITSGPLPTVTSSPYVFPVCPAISTGTKLQVVGILSPPLGVYRAVYDGSTQFLTVIFSNGQTDMFVGVPASAVKSPVVWNSLASYQMAIMAQGANPACPLLAQ